ncbi:MAG: Omp28 family outer membrane lipoprotein [Muribaculaceae bacterium]|nr:Omp28 family outer membrane lipoprotein [Muribaculaceae bacterium]
MKASYITFGLLLLAGIATSCDNISEDDRYYKEEKTPVSRNLLIMEFTGNNCVNCPLGAESVEKIKQDAGADKVISVGLHPEGNINTRPMITNHPKPGTLQNFTCEEATELFKYYGSPNGFPTAIFNGLKSSMSSDYGNWMTDAMTAFDQPSYVKLEAECDFDNSTRDLTVNYKVGFSDDLDESISIAVWLVENKILGVQMMPNGKKNEDYVHNHVLRASLNGTWGEYIGNSFTSTSELTGSASITIADNWVAENCDVVVIAFQDNDKYAQQVISVKVIN